jgi:bacillithiol biosynthesis cysteine-adding enzyme BshC
MSISFNKLPGFNSIFLDYINNFPALERFYKYDFKDEMSFLQCLEEKRNWLSSKSFTRDDIADILTVQNKFFNSSPAVFSNIELLRKDNTFVIVTGQQTGIAGGPLYTIFKALSTIKLAEKLSNLYTDYNFISVFWLEADDHDFLEVNNTTLINKSNLPAEIKYFPNGLEEEKYLKPVSTIVFDEYIENVINEIRDTLQQTDFTETILDLVSRSYKPGIDMKTAFARFMNYLFTDMGLIFFDPSDKEMKTLMAPVFEKELSTYPAVCEIVIDTSTRLENVHTPQVKPRPINLFYTHNGNRYLIEPREDGTLGLKNSRQKFEKNELLSLARSQPESFSGNVITRPILQDFVLPTISYVGGPSEIAYFAQLKGVYEFFEIEMPVIYPRASITLLEKRVTAFLDKYELDLTELLNFKQLSEKLLSITQDINVDELFSNYKDELASLNYTFEKELEKIDKTLVNTFKNRSEKHIESLDALKQKFTDSLLKQNEAALSKLKSIESFIAPDGVLQERVLNILYFINKYSIELIKNLKDDINIDNFSHQLIEAGVKQPEETAGKELFNT